MSGAGWVRAFLTVPAAMRAMANEAAALLDFDAGGALTFDVPLGPEPGAEVTDYGCATLMRPWTADQVATQLLPNFPGARLYSEHAGWTTQAALADAGLVVLTPEA
ncbi:MAG TPA: hypothetical protein VLH81_01545 [Desulfobacterales bacterium]|nr:hypothetical protein [Desulfobacterales bacterium]